MTAHEKPCFSSTIVGGIIVKLFFICKLGNAMIS